MDYRPLGRTDIRVSSICLGTMTWGEQNSEAEGHEQLDYAVAQGINFVDTAEMYAVPGRPETQGATERIIGTWLKARGRRDDIILASKVTGRSAMHWIREDGASPRHTPAQIDAAVEGSLRRLQTDYMDLYQLHWPDRGLPAFGFHSYTDYDPDDMTPLEDILGALARHVEAGNIRHIGVSNESAWGTMKFLQLAEKNGWPRMVSNQCAYNLVNRRFDYDRAEIAMREDVGLLVYSPLAQGYLTGKYRGGVVPPQSRKALFGQFLARYEGPGSVEAVNDCLDTAERLGISPIEFAQKFAETRAFVTSNIIGATTMEQLKTNIDAHKITWTDDMEREADRLHHVHRAPAP